MCTVSVSLLTHSRDETGLKAMLKMRAPYVPRRNWATLSPFGTLNTRITVPLSLAVARSVPDELSVTHARGDLCAWMMLVTLSESASNRMTSPGLEDDELDAEGGAEEGMDGLWYGELGEGRGDG